jgi:hypothetical protein
MSSDFSKVYDSFFTGSLREEELHTRILFLAMFHISDEFGNLTATPSFLAMYANITVEQAQKALTRLQEPDPQSTTEEDEGRRIRQLGPNRWFITNKRRYYEKSRQEDRKEYQAEWQRKRRAKESGKGDCLHVLTDVDNVDPNKERNKEKKETPPISPVPVDGFDVFWLRWREMHKAVGAEVSLNRKPALASYTRAAKRAPPDEILTGLERFASYVSWAGGKKVPMAETWLNQDRWSSEYPAGSKGASPPVAAKTYSLSEVEIPDIRGAL